MLEQLNEDFRGKRGRFVRGFFTTLIVYIAFNIITFPIYIVAFISGIVGSVVGSDAFNVGDLIIIYIFGLTPNLFLFIVLVIAEKIRTPDNIKRFQLNQKANILFLF